MSMADDFEAMGLHTHYSVTVCVTISVLAESKEEAEKLAVNFVWTDDIRHGESTCATAIKTRDQSMLVKRLAVNY